MLLPKGDKGEIQHRMPMYMTFLRLTCIKPFEDPITCTTTLGTHSFCESVWSRAENLTKPFINLQTTVYQLSLVENAHVYIKV